MPLLSLRSRALTAAALAVFASAFGLLAPVDRARADQAPSVQQIIEALKPRKTRGLSVKPTPAEVEKAKVIDDLKSKAAGGNLSEADRAELAKAASDKPSLDMVIYFDFNKATVSRQSRSTLDALGAALQDDSLKGASIMVAGHTDGKGRAEYNQTLSERRADAVRTYLSEKFGISESDVTIVGYGAERLKDPSQPYSGVNRRVTIVNLTDRTASAGESKSQ